MEKLRQFIENHRDEFDDEPLLDGHWERIEQKLAAVEPQQPKKMFWLWPAAGLVAAAAIVLLLWLQPVPVEPDSSHEVEQQELTAMELEFQEAQGYYQMRMNDLTDRLDQLCKQKRTEEAEQLLQAAWQVRSDVKEFEHEVVPTLPCDEDGLYALAQTYSLGIGSLTFLLDRMETM